MNHPHTLEAFIVVPTKFGFRLLAAASLVAVLISADAFAQTVSIGGKFGAPLNDSFQQQSLLNSFTSFTKRYTVGPSFEVMFPAHVGFEANALFNRSGFTQGFSFLNVETKVNSWEFPLMLKAAMPGESVGAFANGGLALRYVQASTGINNPLIPITQQLPVPEPWAHGAVIGGGVSFKIGSFYLEPELRYTRWMSSNFNVPLFASNPNQIEYLLGFKFKK
jgi:hypothetical protein